MREIGPRELQRLALLIREQRWGSAEIEPVATALRKLAEEFTDFNEEVESGSPLSAIRAEFADIEYYLATVLFWFEKAREAALQEVLALSMSLRKLWIFFLITNKVIGGVQFPARRERMKCLGTCDAYYQISQVPRRLKP